MITTAFREFGVNNSSLRFVIVKAIPLDELRAGGSDLVGYLPEKGNVLYFNNFFYNKIIYEGANIWGGGPVRNLLDMDEI